MEVYFSFGTKAELIKSAPVFHRLEEKGIPYSFIHTGQNSEIEGVLRDFDLKPKVHRITRRKRNLKTIPEMAFWIQKAFLKGLFSNHPAKRGDLILVHGDTESTFISSALAKSKGCKLGHIEAGLRSKKLFYPFPEEIIRRTVDRFSDYLFPSGKWASDNLKKSRIKGKIIDTKHNITFDSLSYIADKKNRSNLPKEKYAVILVHRKENLYVGSRLNKMIKSIEYLASKINVIFLLSKNSEPTFERVGLLSSLKKNPRVEIKDYLGFVEFIQLVKGSEFIATDGGSTQEETYFLDKPCLLLRERTERKEGLGETAFLSELDGKKIKYFVENYKIFKRRTPPNKTRASEIVAEKIEAILKNEKK